MEWEDFDPESVARYIGSAARANEDLVVVEYELYSWKSANIRL